MRKLPKALSCENHTGAAGRMERAGLTVPSGRPDKKDRRALAQLRDLDKNWRQAPEE